MADEGKDAAAYLNSMFVLAITNWALFERLVDISVWGMLGLDPKIGACVTNSIQSVRAKIILFEDAAIERGADTATLKNLRKFRQSTCDRISKKRNRLVHDPHMRRGEVFHAFRGSNINHDHDVITNDYLYNFVEECMSLHSDYLKLIAEISIKLGISALRETHP